MKLGSLILGLLLTSTVLQAAPINFKQVREYHKLEASETMLFRDGSILAGRTGTSNEPGSYIEEIDVATHEIKQSILLPHFIRQIQEIDSCNLLVTSGLGYSTVDMCADPAAVNSYRFKEDFVPHTGVPDGQGGILFSEPNAGMYRFVGQRRGTFLGKHITLSRKNSLWDGNLWIPNYGNVYVVNPSNGAKSKVFKNDNEVYGLKETQYIRTSKGESIVIATARDDKKVVLIDSQTKRVTKVIETKGEPEGITTYGDCAVVAISSNKTILFIKIDGQNSRIVDAWEAEFAGDRLKYPAMIEMDAPSQQVFLRSSYPCPRCSVTQSSMYSFSTSDTSKIEECLK